MVRSDNAADGRWVAEPEGTRSFWPSASSLRLHDPSVSGSRSPSFLASSQNSLRRGLDSFPSRLEGRKIDTTIAPASGIGGTTAQSFQYNGLAQTTFARDTAGANNADVTLVYDSIQRTVEEAQAYGGNTRYVTNDGFTSLPVSQFTYPNSRQVNNSFDKLYRRQQIIEAATSAVIATWQYFGANRIATVTLGNGLVCSNMNNAQSRSAIQSGLPTPAWGSIATDQLGYDGAGRMIGKRYFNGTNVIVGFTSAYDMSSNKLFERPLHAEERASLYDSYDSMNRLLDYQRGTLATGGGGVTTPIALPDTDSQRNYNLDALGNWTSSVYTPEGGSQITDQRNHNKLNQITLRSVGGTSPTYFSYDGASGASNGNLTNDGTFYYQYDALNRPIAITTVHGQLVGTYVYDALNRRVRKTVTNGGVTGNVPNGTTDYIWSGWQVAEERNASDTPTRQYIWGNYVDECVQLTTLAVLGPQSLPAGTYYLLQDFLFRAVGLTNSSGATVEAYDCDAYGNTLIFTAPDSSNNWWGDAAAQSAYGANENIYCGYHYDPETELYYVRNRTYNPVLGRWLQRDPIGYAGGVNLYEYVGGRATVATDPWGRDVQTACQSKCWTTCGGIDSPACQNCITCCEYAGENAAAAAGCFPSPPPPPGPHPFGCGCSKSLCEQRCGEIASGAVLACSAGCAIGCLWARADYGKCFVACDGLCSSVVAKSQAACTVGCAACPNP